MSKEAVHSVILKKSKETSKLIYLNTADETAYKVFVDSLEPEQLVQIFFDANLDNGTLTQLAKIKVCIRELAKEMGSTFETTEKYIKGCSGLIIQNDDIEDIKSFGKCSVDELNMVIQVIIEKGDFLGMNLR